MTDFSTTIRRRNLPPVAARRRTVRVVATPDRAALGRRFDLDGTTWEIGRGANGPGAITDHLMSREHVRLRLESSDRYLVEDLGGSNGTFVNGVRLGAPVPLQNGDVLSCGDTLFVADAEPDPDLLPAAEHIVGTPVGEWVGVSYAAERVRRAIGTVSNANGSVLLLGATGSGKEVAAKAIHRLSGRDGPWVPVNCAAIPAEIAEAEFFGYKRGAFTGAVTDRDGFFVSASGGTLFLDEVGDLPVPLQAKLLRVLEDGSIQSLGGGPPRQVDLRVVAGTHIDLDRAGFRRDLLARLGDWVLHLPPLRERRADILVLWEHFVALESRGEEPRMSTAEFAEALLLHEWPMNVRELQKLARRLCTLAGSSSAFDLPLLPEAMQRPIRARPAREGAGTAAQPVTMRQGPPPSAPSPPPSPSPAASPTSMDPDFSSGGTEAGVPDRATLEAALRQAKGNVSLVAEQNGWHRTQLYRWIRRAGLDPDSFR